MAILEMIPPEYWRRLKRELDDLRLDDITIGALPDGHPAERRQAYQHHEAMQQAISELRHRLSEERKLRLAAEEEAKRLRRNEYQRNYQRERSGKTRKGKRGRKKKSEN